LFFCRPSEAKAAQIFNIDVLQLFHVTNWSVQMAETAIRVREHRQRLRMAGLRPVQIWVPDTRRPDFAEECLRQGQIVAVGDKADIQLHVLMDEALNSIEGWE
jgi:Protein  of unknown function (DUF3018)